MSDEKIVKEFQEQYIDTLVAVRAGLENLVGGQKALYDHIIRNSDKQTEQLANIAADIRVMREQNANLHLKLMMANPKDMLIKRNGENGNGNGNGHPNSNGNGKNGKNGDVRKELKEKLDSEEELDRELMYRYIGKFMTKNWKFLLVVLILAVAGALIVFGGHSWVEWLSKAPVVKTP